VDGSFSFVRPFHPSIVPLLPCARGIWWFFARSPLRLVLFFSVLLSRTQGPPHVVFSLFQSSARQRQALGLFSRLPPPAIFITDDVLARFWSKGKSICQLYRRPSFLLFPEFPSSPPKSDFPKKLVLASPVLKDMASISVAPCSLKRVLSFLLFPSSSFKLYLYDGWGAVFFNVCRFLLVVTQPV